MEESDWLISVAQRLSPSPVFSFSTQKDMNSKALRTIIGGVLIHLSIGAIYTASNMITYIISYIHVLLENQVISELFCMIFRVLP